MESLKINGNPVREYTITAGGLNITTFVNSKLPSEEQISFENIKKDRFFHIEKSLALLIGAGVVALVYFLILGEFIKNKESVFVISITWPILAIGLFVSYFVLQQKVYFLKTFTGKYIKFKVKDNEAEVASFVKYVIEKRNSFLKDRYGTPNSQMSYDAQYSNFIILHREGVITDEEYRESVTILNSTFERTVPRQTFEKYSQN